MENPEEEEKITFENELKKAKLIAEKGAQFNEFSNLPPEIEAQWLDHISAFEDSFQNAKMTTIRKFIGNHEFRPAQEVSDEKIAEELDKVNELLGQNDIVLDTIGEVEKREIYRFIVEELLDKEIEDMRIKGFVTHFIYEEFHPNHEHDIQNAIKEYLSTLFSGKKEFWDMNLANEIVSSKGEILKSDEVESFLNDFS